ncbi:MAG: acyltransferase [Myxococcales bacterium]|nr:acyltransferase [Myxococcales bacterium]
MSSPPRQRFALIDALRGVAATSVMLYHYGTGDLRAPLAAKLPALAMLLMKKGWIGVQIFFVLSGYVIANTVGLRRPDLADAARFSLRRQVRLDPPYWVAMLVAVGVPWYLKLTLHDQRPVAMPRQVLAHLVYLQDILHFRPIQPVFWTLAIEVQLYMAFIVMLALLRRLPWAVSCVALVLSWAASLHAAVHWRFIGTGLFFVHWYLFALGAAVCWVRLKRFDARWVAPMLGVCLYAAARIHRLEPLFGALTAGVLLAAGRRDGLSRWLNWAPLTFLGRVSYGIYLLHPMAGSITRWRLSAFFGHDTFWGAVAMFVNAFIWTLVASHFLHTYVEKPAMAWAGRITWYRGPRPERE